MLPVCRYTLQILLKEKEEEEDLPATCCCCCVTMVTQFLTLFFLAEKMSEKSDVTVYLSISCYSLSSTILSYTNQKHIIDLCCKLQLLTNIIWVTRVGIWHIPHRSGDVPRNRTQSSKLIEYLKNSQCSTMSGLVTPSKWVQNPIEKQRRSTSHSLSFLVW